MNWHLQRLLMYLVSICKVPFILNYVLEFRCSNGWTYYPEGGCLLCKYQRFQIHPFFMCEECFELHLYLPLVSQ